MNPAAAPDDRPLLIVLTGATGSGKTDLAISLAQRLGCDITGADSRQLYRDIPIATAAPTPEQLSLVRHHMVGTLPLDAYYSAARYADEVLALLPRLMQQQGVALMCGGSMMYVDAVTRGIDPLPTISDEVRTHFKQLEAQIGPDVLLEMLREADPDYYAEVDRNNMRRVIHALEITQEAGRPYSSLRTGQPQARPFRTLKLAIDLPREELFGRINRRVERMELAGLVEEARRVYPLRHLNSLNAVGFREMFAYFEGRMTLPEALARMAKNTRVYAKKQMLWMRGDPELHRLNPLTAEADALALIGSALGRKLI